MRAALVSEALRDALHLDRRGIQFAFVDRHDLNSSINCAEQQKTVGLWATRSKALELRSKLLCFQYCEARGQAPPLKVAGVPVRKRCLIASVQYAIPATKVNVSRVNDVEEHVAACTVPPSVDAPAAGRREDEPGSPLVGIRDVPAGAVMRLRPESQLSARSIRGFRSNIEGSVTSHPPHDFGLGPGFDRHGSKDERPQVGALHLRERCLRRQCT